MPAVLPDIEMIKSEIVEKLKPLEPKRIILFGSFAYGQPNEYSDIDIFLVKDLDETRLREFEIDAKMKLLDTIYKHKIGIDILSASDKFLQEREDYFYKVDIMQNGKVLYVKQN